MNIRSKTARCGYIACLIAGALASGGCESLMESARSVVPSQEKAPQCAPLPLGSFRRDRLCYGSKCTPHCYAVTLNEASVLRIDNFSTNDHPRFRVEVTDSAKRSRATGEWTNQRQPTILRESLEAGSYEVRLSALEPNASQALYDFKVMAEPAAAARAPRPPTRPRPRKPVVDPPKPKPTAPEQIGELAPPEPPDAPEPPEDALPAEPLGPALPPCALTTFIVFLEPTDIGSPIAMLGAGRKDGLQVGAVGDLNLDGATVGEIEVTELLPSGSRARIVRSDSGAIRDDTIDMIDVCIKYP